MSTYGSGIRSTNNLKKHKSDYYCGLIHDNAGNGKKIWSYLKQIIPSSQKSLPNSVKVNDDDCTVLHQLI